MKFHTQFRPGDLVRDKKTGDEGVIVVAQAQWYDNKCKMRIHRGCRDIKRRNEIYIEGSYGIFSKTRYGSLNGWWFHDDQLELVQKGLLH